MRNAFAARESKRRELSLFREDQLVTVREPQTVIAAGMLNHDLALLAEKIFGTQTRDP
jgi:hypothetical protein